MKIKTKVTLGVVFLFAVILSVGGLGLYYLSELSTDAKHILTDNHESLEYTKRIIENCDSLQIDSSKALAAMEANLQLQEQNITERGEQQMTLRLRKAFEELKQDGITSEQAAEVRKICLAIQSLNMQAIIKKNEQTQQTASRASDYVIIAVTVFSLIAFTFIVNFPGYVANPIVKLTESIKSIANKNYEERLHFNRRDEFEELAEAFNLMAEKLDEYEHSSLAKILFEKKRIETIINRMSDPVIGLDEKKKVVFANDQAFTLLNLMPNQVLEKYAPDVAVENDLFRNLIKLNGEAGEESRLIKVVLNGKENYFSKENIPINYKPTGENDPVAVGQVILLKNVTPYKELDLAKTNFIATISHELKTPIASLQMCTKLLLDDRVGKMNDEQQNIMRTMQDETTRLAKITNELLDLTQVETGNIKLNLQKNDPKDIINYALDAVKFHTQKKGVHINVKVPDGIGFIHADIDKTTWVLVNLLTNAIRYSPENSSVELNCSHENNMITFSVIDYGQGIEEKYIDRLFEKFFQVPGSPSGTGLGLAISKEFIEAQGGKIFVESKPGMGSKFTFDLPSAF